MTETHMSVFIVIWNIEVTWQWKASTASLYGRLDTNCHGTVFEGHTDIWKGWKKMEGPRKLANKMNLGWYDWDKQLDNHFSQKRRMIKIPLNYLIMWDKSDAWNLIINVIDIHQWLIFQAWPKGGEFNLNNWTLPILTPRMQLWALEELVYEFIHSFKGQLNGRGSIIA